MASLAPFRSDVFIGKNKIFGMTSSSVSKYVS